MPSLISVAIAGSLGLLVYVLIPMVANLGNINTRKRVGETYYKMEARLLKQFTFLRRVLSGYDVKPIGVDNERKLLTLTLGSNLMGDDETYPFEDPDGRIKRLYNKPAALAYERVPAAIDAELAEIGRWVAERRENGGFWSGEFDNAEVETTVKPWVVMSDGFQLVDPLDSFEIVPNDIDPENVKSTEIMTEKRFEKYRGNLGMREGVLGVMGFLTGAGGMAGMAYVRDKLLDGGGGGVPEAPVDIGLTIMPPEALELLVVLL